MKLKLILLALLIGVVALNTLPAYATDFSGYAEATYGTNWTSDFPYVIHVYNNISRDTARRFTWHMIIHNVGEIPLTEAILLINLTKAQYFDEAGIKQTTTDPAEIAQIVYLQNAGEMWQGCYVIWLGTIQPGHSRRALHNWWIAANWFSFTWTFSVWYLS